MSPVVARISFFVNAGVRFVEEMAKMRAFARLWDEITRDRYGVADPRHRRLRYGVQVNSLGLTEAQPENNVQRIVLEMLGVTLSRDARARAVQLPAWNEALGLPRPWDQQWSLRIQQVLAYETDLLEYPDIFEGSVVMDGLDAASVGEAVAKAQPEVIVHQMTGLSLTHAGRLDMKHPGRYFANTNRLRIQGTDHLLAAAEAAGVSQFVAQSNATGTQGASAATLEQTASMQEMSASAQKLARTSDALREMVTIFRL